jgi:hypothetical protein
MLSVLRMPVSLAHRAVGLASAFCLCAWVDSLGCCWNGSDSGCGPGADVATLLQALVSVVPRRTTATGPVETNLDVLLMNPTLCPPDHPLYGSQLKQFFVSPIYFFEGKPWQLRTVLSDGKHFVFPVIVNTGGLNANLPIFCDNALKMMFPAWDRSTFQLDRIKSHPWQPRLPSPLGDNIDIRRADWDSERRGRFAADVVKFNLVGHELAKIIDEMDGVARNIKEDPSLQVTVEKSLQAKASRFRRMGFADCAVELLKREVDSLLSVPLDTKWTEDELPIPKHLFV